MGGKKEQRVAMSGWLVRQRIIVVKHFKDWVHKYHNVKNMIPGTVELESYLLWRDLGMILISMLMQIQNESISEYMQPALTCLTCWSTTLVRHASFLWATHGKVSLWGYCHEMISSFFPTGGDDSGADTEDELQR